MTVASSKNFASCYMDLCKQQRLRPLPVISVTLPHSLDFTTDRVKMEDWGPLLNSLSLDHSLKSVSVRSRYQCRKPLEEVNTENKARATGKAPAILTRFLLEWLSHSVGQCVRNSPVLTSLELEGIPLPPDCLAVLCVGLASTNTLKHFSLQRCRIGDGSCELICRTVADVQSIRSLNLGQCDLTHRSGPTLAAALSRQKLILYHDTWKDSLRYREPNLEAMPGLRRLTLNGNPQMGDLAIREIIEAIRDSLWLKALDLQNCGITESAASQFLDLLNSNLTLAVVDLRLNAVREQILWEISNKLEANNGGASSEYHWMCLPQNSKSASVTTAQRYLNPDRGVAAKTTLPRSRRTVSRQPKSPCRQAAPKRASTASSVARQRIEIKPSNNPTPSPAKPGDTERLKIVENPEHPRASLHLDLRADLCRSSNAGGGNPESGRDGENFVEERPEYMVKNEASPQVDEIFRQLIEAKARHEQLFEETKRNDLLLAEEKLRREIAEAKLRALNENLADLEATLKTKEEETRGYLLISQQSLDEICLTFDRLLEMLDSVTKNPNTLQRNTDEESVDRETIKRHLAHLVRKTKSESLSRNVSPEARTHGPADNLRPEMINRKTTRSEANLRSTLPPISVPIHLEKNIGDSPDLMSPLHETSRFADAKLYDSPGRRARAIFAQIVRDGSLSTIGSHVG
ncbi:centrosomal protein of 78 kDa [Neodiprion pinetum]|uniref:centrosomal protein of 78 kDa n=1 Tax=Neodiprion pinetum TaxID=441929 RepID=UPI00371B6FC4